MGSAAWICLKDSEPGAGRWHQSRTEGGASLRKLSCAAARRRLPDAHGAADGELVMPRHHLLRKLEMFLQLHFAVEKTCSLRLRVEAKLPPESRILNKDSNSFCQR